MIDTVDRFGILNKSFMQHCDKILQFLQGCSMLKRSLVLTLLFLVTTHLSAMDDNSVVVVVAPAPQKVQQGLLGWLLSSASGPHEATISQSQKPASQGMPPSSVQMLYMSPEEEARQKAFEETKRKAQEITSSTFYLYPGGPAASPEPRVETTRCALKVSFGCNGCCP